VLNRTDTPFDVDDDHFYSSAGSELEVVQGEHNMKPSTQNEIAGKAHEVKGKIKEKAGGLTHDADLESEGISERIAGIVQKKLGRVQRIVEKP
jgi:uncharacterized protein YjbJ (UPF0337 family)